MGDYVFLLKFVGIRLSVNFCFCFGFVEKDGWIILATVAGLDSDNWSQDWMWEVHNLYTSGNSFFCSYRSVCDLSLRFDTPACFSEDKVVTVFETLWFLFLGRKDIYLQTVSSVDLTTRYLGQFGTVWVTKLCCSFDLFSSSDFCLFDEVDASTFNKKFIFHAPSLLWTANMGGNRPVGLSPGQMYKGYMGYIEWHWVHSLGHARPFSLSAPHDTGRHSVSCIGPGGKFSAVPF